jgi:hypothetical protein
VLVVRVCIFLSSCELLVDDPMKIETATAKEALVRQREESVFAEEVERSAVLR